MSLTFLAIAFTLILTLAYWSYGSWLSRVLGLDDQKITPAHEKCDGVDYVPTPAFYLFGQHFSAIAAAGPIAGPIAACLAFGWLPCLIWILMGVVMIGAVHDFTSLTASVRHGADSIAEVARSTINSAAGRAMMVFIWLALIYVLVAFSDITAGTFVSSSEELEALNVSFNAGGAVAAASVLYLILSLILGVVQRFLNPPLWVLCAIFVPLTFGASWAGTLLSHLFLFDVKTWAILILLYCGIASVMPVWLLLQPRGFLGGFILYFALGVGLFGILFGGFEIQQPAWTSFDIGTPTGLLFPFLFVTIACGACSGFHGLVCSGTTSKQVDRESHMHPIGYGAMLAEGLVAFIALTTVMIATSDQVNGLRPGAIYGKGLGEYLSLIIGREHLPLAITMGAMAFSTFVFDTLDVAARLGRYLVQELFGLRGWFGLTVGTVATLGIPIFVVATGKEGSWLKYWILFGASNQLLASLTLLVVTLWMHQNRRPIWITLLPMIFVLLTTLTALVLLVRSSWQSSQGWDGELLNALISLCLIGVALFICASALWKILSSKKEKRASALR